MYNFIEVCSGAGGLSLGFIKEGFKPVLLNDNNKICCNTLKLNHPDINIINDNMTNINYNNYKNIDLLMGGVPCQSFSYSGKKKGLDDNRGMLIDEFIKIVHNITPKTFLIENVKGLKTINKGEIFEYIINKLNKNNNYNIYYKILNSNDYNVPQNRERLIIFANRTKDEVEQMEVEQMEDN